MESLTQRLGQHAARPTPQSTGDDERERRRDPGEPRSGRRLLPTSDMRSSAGKERNVGGEEPRCAQVSVAILVAGREAFTRTLPDAEAGPPSLRKAPAASTKRPLTVPGAELADDELHARARHVDAPVSPGQQVESWDRRRTDRHARLHRRAPVALVRGFPQSWLPPTPRSRRRASVYRETRCLSVSQRSPSPSRFPTA